MKFRNWYGIRKMSKGKWTKCLHVTARNEKWRGSRMLLSDLKSVCYWSFLHTSWHFFVAYFPLLLFNFPFTYFFQIQKENTSLYLCLCAHLIFEIPWMPCWTVFKWFKTAHQNQALIRTRVGWYKFESGIYDEIPVITFWTFFLSPNPTEK